MLKKLCLSAAFPLLSFASMAAFSDRITTIQNSLTHIIQEKAVITLEIEKTNTGGARALKNMISTFKDEYAFLQSKIISIINRITQSEEFNDTVDIITDYQLSCIVDKGMPFKAIEYNPHDYVINKKIQSELSEAFPAIDAEINRLFNVFYIMAANNLGGKFLCKKLTEKEDELRAELVALEAANHTEKLN